jgi:hypothetical protein
MNIPSLATALLERARRGARADPARDWLALLALSAIALAGIVVWNVWAFETVAGGGAIGVPPAKTASPAVPDRAALDAVRTLFEGRAAEKAKYSNGAYRYADPSQ